MKKMGRSISRVSFIGLTFFGILLCGNLTSPTAVFGHRHTEFVATASAQGLLGGGRGPGSGGTSGGVATPHGAGAGGSTAGSNGSAGAGPNGATTSTGPGAVNQNRFGGTFPTNPPPDEPTTTPTTDAVMKLLNNKEQNAISLPGRCGTHPINGLGPRERMKGANLEFLKTAQIYLAPDFKPGRETTGLHLIADYQEELEKVKPDATLAGAYLALVATRPVTQEMVARTNAILCVTATSALIAEIARNASSDRRAELQ